MTPFISADRLRLLEDWERQACLALGDAEKREDAEAIKRLTRRVRAYRVRIKAIQADDKEFGECL